MKKVLEKYLLKPEYLFKNKYTTENQVIHEAYSITTSKIIIGYKQEEDLFCAKDGKSIALYTSKYWVKLDTPLLKQFLKTVVNKIEIPEYIASRVRFINKLQKQFMQDSYFEKVQVRNLSFVNVSNGIELENHNPRLFLNYLIYILNTMKMRYIQY